MTENGIRNFGTREISTSKVVLNHRQPINCGVGHVRTREIGIGIGGFDSKINLIEFRVQKFH